VAERCEGYRLFVRKPFREADLLRALEQVWSAPG
jgi:hypothetical protein